MARRRSVRLAMTALATLIVANLVVMCINVYHFLPDHQLTMSSSSSSQSQLVSKVAAPSTRSPPMQMAMSSSTKTVTLMEESDMDGDGSEQDGREISVRLREAEAEAEAMLQSKSSATGSASVVRYDIVPKMLELDNVHSVVHQLPSIPDRRRMVIGVDGVPADAVHNLTYFLESRLRPHEEDRPLYVYNPMLLPLNIKYLDDVILDDLYILMEETIDDEYEMPPAYVAAYRVSNFGNCHGPGRGVPDTFRNYLGLALLDQNLNIVRTKDNRRHTDIVIDLNRHLFDAKWPPKPPKLMEKQYMQDCQLIAAAPSPPTSVHAKADRLILICNAYAMHVRLERTGTFKWAARYHKDAHNVAIRFENTFGFGLQMTALEMPNMISKNGKNLHYFRTEAYGIGEEGAGEGYLEIWPGGPHETMRMDFVNYNDVPMINSIKPEPEASFTTIDGGSSSPLTPRDSGSACCVSIRWRDDNDEDGEGRRLLLGFSHRKTRRGLGQDSPQYNYVSRVYAFEPTPPFNLVVRSGFFCLGFMHRHIDDEADEIKDVLIHNEQVWGSANDYRLKIHGEVFDCPSIHFVTGIADKLGEEEETVIVSYGVNDCYPRMIEVSKKVLVRLLKESPIEEAR